MSSNDISGSGYHVDNEDARFGISNSVILLLETGLSLIPMKREKSVSSPSDCKNSKI